MESLVAKETERLQSQTTQNDVVVINDSTSDQSPSKSMNNDSYALLKLIYKKIDAIENHIIKLDVRIANISDVKSVGASSSSDLGHIDMAQLEEFGLPVQSELMLEKFEENLKTNHAFKAKLVC